VARSNARLGLALLVTGKMTSPIGVQISPLLLYL